MRDKFLKNSCGNVAIEFALVMPLLFLILSGIMNFGRVLGNKNQLNTVVSVGMLYAFGNSSTPAGITAAMTATLTPPLPNLTLTATKVCKCYPVSGTPSGAPTEAACTAGCATTLGSYIKLTATSQVDLMALDFIMANPFPTTSSATIRIQ